jgi:virginiamycin B lyase
MQATIERPRYSSRWGAALLVPLAAFALVLLVSSAATASQRAITPTQPVDSFAQQPGPPGQAYVFRFDPALGSFETFTIPTAGARPHSVGVMPGQDQVDVWFTMPGTDQIGRLVYKDTGDYQYLPYTLTLGSQPLNLVVDQAREMVWFTEHLGNRIGRLELGSGSAVTYTSFAVPTANSRPAGIDLAPDGSVWFTEMAADQAGRLVVRTPTDYDLTEYAVSGTETDVGLYGVAVQSNEYIWLAETHTGRIRRLAASTGRSIYVSLGQGSWPYAMVVDEGRDFVWATELDRDRITQIEIGTLYLPNSFTPAPGFVPTGLTMVGSDQFWFAGKGTSRIGRLFYQGTHDFSFDLFELPVQRVWGMDIEADPNQNLWTVAYVPHDAMLPLVATNP